MVGWALRPWKPLRWWVGPVLLAVVGVGGGSAMAFELQSAAFSSGEQIPAKHTCDGRDAKPQLRWSDPPPNTRSFALIMDDPDAPGGRGSIGCSTRSPRRSTTCLRVWPCATRSPGSGSRG